jgi:hypothetical protein
MTNDVIVSFAASEGGPIYQGLPMNDIYAPPSSPLNEPPADGNSGSLERGINGDYQFTVGAVISEAWAKTKGAKWTIQLALTLYMVIYIAVLVVIGVATTGSMMGAMHEQGQPGGGSMLASLLSYVVISAVIGPLAAGLFMLGVKRAVGEPITAFSILGYYNKVVPIFVTMLLQTLLILVGFVLLILPGIYLSIAYYLALPLVVDKNLGPWEALEASRKAIGKRWFGVFGLMIVVGLINVATVFTLGIGLIWTIPLSIIAIGILYRNVFGYSGAMH